MAAATKTRELKVVITGDERDAKRMLAELDDDADRSATGLGDKFAMAGKAVVAGLAVASAAVVAFGVKSVGAFVDFDRSMNEVFTLLPGISAKSMDQMTDQVKAFSKEFGVLPDQVVPALYQSLSAGVPQENVFEFLRVAQMAAKGGVTELSVAVDGISSVVNAYGKDVLSATTASDLMFTTVRLGKTTFQQLSESLFNVTPTAAALGVKFGDVTAALAALTLQGIPTSVATTQLRQMFVELSKQGSATAATFEKIAGKSFRDFIKGGGNVAGALELMAKKAKESNLSVSDMFGSVEAGSAALALVSGMDTFKADIDAMGHSAGATKTAWEQMQQGLGPILDKIKAGFAVFMIEVGEKIAPVLIAAWDKLPGVFASVREAMEPVVAWAIEHWPGFRDAIVGAWNEAKDAIVGAWNEVSPSLLKFAQEVMPEIVNLTRDLGPVAKDSWHKFQESVSEFWTAAEPALGPLAEALKLILKTLRFIADAWDKLPTAQDAREWGSRNLPSGSQLTNPFGNPFGPVGDLADSIFGASGAIVKRPTRATIGEAGPEAVIPLDQAPGASPLPAGFGGSGGPTVVIHVAGSVVTERQLIELVRDGLTEYDRRRGAA